MVTGRGSLEHVAQLGAARVAVAADAAAFERMFWQAFRGDEHAGRPLTTDRAAGDPAGR